MDGLQAAGQADYAFAREQRIDERPAGYDEDDSLGYGQQYGQDLLGLEEFLLVGLLLYVELEQAAASAPLRARR
jgi:hypothetical protein